MKNLKRALSFALASVMVIGMMVVGAGAAFTDADEIVNDDAVNTLVALNVLNGKGDGSYFDPTATVTRGEMAKMITVALNGGKAPVIGTKTTPTYADIDGHWAEAYIEYCSNLGIIAGYNGMFRPNDVVTGTEAAKMMLVAMGYEPTIFEFTGANWALNVNTQANKADLYDGLEEIDPSAGLSRDNAAQLVYNGILAETMTKEPNMSVTNGNITWNYTAEGPSIFADKYNGKVWIGTFVGNYATGAAIEENEIRVDGKLDTDPVADPDLPAYPVSDLDIKYIGEEVKVLFKDVKGGTADEPDDIDVIYGVFVTGATKVLNVTLDDITSNTTYTTAGKIKVDGVEYKVVYTVGEDAVVYNYDVANANSQNRHTATAKDDFGGLSAQKGDTVKFIFDAEGRICKAYVTETTLQYVSAVNGEKVTITNVGSIKIADHNVYEGIAKNDVVTVTTLYNRQSGSEVVEYTVKKAEVVSGTVNGYKGTENVVLDGETYEIYNKRNDMPTTLANKTGEASFTTGDIGETFDLYMVNGKVGAAVQTSASANNYSWVIDKNNGSLGSNWDALKVVVLGADGVKTTLTLHEDSENPDLGAIVTWTGAADSAKVKVQSTVSAANYNKDTKSIGAYATTADAVLFAEVTTNAYDAVADTSFKAYAIRSLDSYTASYDVVVKNGKVVAAKIDLLTKPAGAKDSKVYGIVSGYTGIVEVEDTEYHVYTIVNDAETYTVKVEDNTGNTNLTTGSIVAFNPSTDGLYADATSFDTSFDYTGFVKEYNEADATITVGSAWDQPAVDGAYTVTADAIYAIADDAKVVYVNQNDNKAGDVIGINAFDSVTGWKNVKLDVEDSKVVAIIVETSNKCDI